MGCIVWKYGLLDLNLLASPTKTMDFHIGQVSDPAQVLIPNQCMHAHLSPTKSMVFHSTLKHLQLLKQKIIVHRNKPCVREKNNLYFPTQSLKTWTRLENSPLNSFLQSYKPTKKNYIKITMEKLFTTAKHAPTSMGVSSTRPIGWSD